MTAASLMRRRIAVVGLALLCLIASATRGPGDAGVRWPDAGTLAAALPVLDVAVSVRVTIDAGGLAQAVAGMVRR